MVFRDKDTLGSFRRLLNTDVHAWIVLAGFVFVTSPAGILIGQLTSQWSRKIDDPENSLANAGKWIGMVERGTLMSIGIAILTGLVVKLLIAS